MEKTNVTKKCKRVSIILAILSWLLCYGTAIVFFGLTFGGKTSDVNFIEKYGIYVVSAAVGFFGIILLSIIIKGHLEPTVWMINMLLSMILFNTTVAIIVFGIWFVDNYIIKAVQKRYKQRYLINKEIDRRE